jgi:DNA polymerase III epsilon subunit family exonuclease
MEEKIKIPKDILKLPLDDISFIVFDTETSLVTYPGQPAFYDVVEIGCAAFNLKVGKIDSFCSLVKPYYPFNRVSCKAMHITEDLLADSPRFPEIVVSLGRLFANRVVVGQNTQFDVRTVRQALDLYSNLGQITKDIELQLASVLEWEYLDTKRIFSQLFPSEKQKSLDAIAVKLGVDNKRTKHSALEDACLTLEVFRKLVDLARCKNIVTLGHLFNFQAGEHGKPKQISFF